MKASLKQSFITNENLDDKLFYNALAEELNEIIEEELSKSYEDINAELIDDCCLALTAIYELQSGENKSADNIININSIIRKYNIRKRRRFIISAACAAVMAFTVGNAIFTVADGKTIVESEIIKSAAGKLEEIFNRKEPVVEETTTKESTTEQTYPLTETTVPVINQTTETPSTVTTREIKNITVTEPAGFDSTFGSRNEIALDGFLISVNYTDGEAEVIPISFATYEIGETQEDGFTEIKIYYKGFTTSYYVTVLPEEKLNPVTVTSLYGAFEDGYTIADMRVFAVLSDGTQKEIPKSDCVIITEEFSDGEETGTIVTVEYENCSFQFLSE